MNNKPVTGNGTPAGRESRAAAFFRHMWRDRQLWLLVIPPIIYIAIFHYWPMYGAQIAFRNYKPKAGVTGSQWVGLKWFRKFLGSYNFSQIFSNTVILSLYSLIVTFILAVTFALLLNTIRNEKFKSAVQNITYIPHFISIVVTVSIVNMIFNPVNGVYGTFFRLLGGEGYPMDFRALDTTFRHLYVWSGVWQNLGWDTIIYVAAFSSVSQDHHEAAMIDGATRFQRILHVDLPAILPTAAIMLILRFGSVMTLGFEKVYLMQTNLNLPTSEVISTYVYKTAMNRTSDFSYSSAIGLFNSVINCLLLIFVNWVSKKMTSDEVSLF